MAIKKKYLKSGAICKVTFTLEQNIMNELESIHLVGDFNNWESDYSPMKKSDKGIYSISLELESNKQYQFRYLLNKTTWLNDERADFFVPSPYIDSDNSLLIL